MIPELTERKSEIDDLCRRFGVCRLEAFGSAVTGRFSPERSDLDFVVEFEPPTGPATPIATSGCWKGWNSSSAGPSN